MSDDPVADEIAAIQAQIKPLEERVRQLRKRQEYPSVTPVQVYWRHYQEHREDYDDHWGHERGLLEQAYRSLEYMAEDGQCSPVGVELGGVMFKQGELRARFGSIY